MFDTNVWITIDGGNPSPNFASYSDFYGLALRSDNKIVINEYVIGEFFNRSCKTAYRLTFPDDPNMKNFKLHRKNHEDFRMQVETVRDTCLNMLDDCEFEAIPFDKIDFSRIVIEAAQGSMDFTDLVLREHAKVCGHILVTHDGDFRDCGVELVTANKKLLSVPQSRARNGAHPPFVSG